MWRKCMWNTGEYCGLSFDSYRYIILLSTEIYISFMVSLWISRFLHHLFNPQIFSSFPCGWISCKTKLMFKDKLFSSSVLSVEMPLRSLSGIDSLEGPKPAKKFLPRVFLLQILIQFSFKSSDNSLNHIFLGLPLLLLPHGFHLWIDPSKPLPILSFLASPFLTCCAILPISIGGKGPNFRRWLVIQPSSTIS